MVELSAADHTQSPPQVNVPRDYNAAHDLIERNLRAGRKAKLAYVDDSGEYTYDDLADRVNRAANALLNVGLQPEQRALLCVLDGIDFPAAFLGCIKAGIVPIAVSTMLKTSDYEYMLRDSRACALIVSSSLLPVFEPLLGKLPQLKHVIVSGAKSASHPHFASLLQEAKGDFEPAHTCADDPCFWLYSSGSTGAPKGTIHVHGSLIRTAELYARPILGLAESDVIFSAPKLYFAYGLGNALTFPLSVGATTILMAERPTPDAVFARLTRYKPTVFCGVPTLYGALLAASSIPDRSALHLHTCVSAGEALPREIGERWSQRFGVDILDGIGSTEMLHIFLSNRRDDIAYGTTGTPVPGYEVRIVDEDGSPVRPGEIGELQVSGPTAAMSYWNNREKSCQTFHGPWTRCGDKYWIDERGHYVYAGRSDDMLKVSGMYVSPVEVESALITHQGVLEAAVVGREDDGGLVKPAAFVVLKGGWEPGTALCEELKAHVKSRLAPFKYPRWIEFLPELPKTSTGKIQRFKLRAAASGS